MAKKKLKRYTVCVAVYAEKYIAVEAENEEQAKDIAVESEENSFGLCNYCSNHFELANHQGEAVSVEESDDE